MTNDYRSADEQPVTVAEAAKEAMTDSEQIATPDQMTTSTPRRWRWAPRWIVAVCLVVVGAASALTFSSGTNRHPGRVDSPDPTSLYTVTRQNLSSQAQVPATLGYAGSYTVVNQARGIVTSLPSVGEVVRQGQVLYAVDGDPVIVLYGSTPAYRSLAEGMSGADVTQLNTDLVTLGFATRTELESSLNHFSTETRVAVEGLQSTLGMVVNGTLSIGQAVFAPTAVRVTSVLATLGAAAQPNQPVAEATSTTRQINVALDASLQSEVAVGDKVTITLPNNRSTAGVISSVGSVATAPASDVSPTITVLVKPTDAVATGNWDETPVSVTITASRAPHALVVPVDALLAKSNGAYAVEVTGAHASRHLVTVSLGLFDDAAGLVQVTNTDLAVGQRVVVPNL